MQCRSCGTDNKPERKFCSGCGAALARACPACGFANDAVDKFCGGCGAALGKTEAESESDLRPASILFADLSGYTELSAKLEPDELQELLNAFFAEADAAVAAAGGHIDKHIGDCVMAVFGAPVAHGDDVAHAAAAALDIVARVRALASARNLKLDCHCGLATGLVAAGDTGSGHHSSYTVTGQTVNLAARLCDRAKGGEILADAETIKAIEERFAFGAPRGEALDGFAGAMRCAPLLARQETRGASRAGIVGRDREVRLGLALLEACRDTRRGQVLLLRGEPGLGKSHLSEELGRAAQARGFTVKTVQITSFGAGLDADPMRGALRALAGIEAGDVGALDDMLAAADAPPHIAALAYELAGMALPNDLARHLSALDVKGRELGRRELLARAAAVAAGEAPLLLIVEDVHLAGREMIEAMAALGRSFAALPAVLMMTARPEGDPIDAAFRHSLGGTPLTVIELAPLDEADARQLLRVLASENPGLDRLVERAGGNPLFLVQLAQYAMQGGDELPSNIRSLVAARFDRLTRDGRRTLQGGAVLGQRFAAPDLAVLREGGPVATRELFEHHLLRPTEDVIAFVHALVREAIYDMLTKTVRRRLHGLAARCFAGRDVALEAHHLDRAGDPRAAEAYWRAGEAARAGQRLATALDLNDRGMTVATGGERMRLLIQRGEVLLELGEAAKAEAVWREASSEDSAERPRALIGVAQALRLQGRREEALKATDEARAILDAERSPALMALLHNVRGNLLFTDHARCAEEHGRSLDWARRAGSVEAEARALGGLGDAQYSQGRYVSAARSFRDCVALAERHGLGRIALANRPMEGWCRFLCGDVAGTREVIDAVIAEAAAIGAKRPEMIAQHSRAILCEEAGDFDGALAAVGRAETLARELGAALFVSEAQCLRVPLLLQRGEPEAARTEAREALKIARGSDMTFNGPWCLALLAMTTEDAAERQSAIAEAEARLAQGVVSHNHAIYGALMILFHAERGEWQEVRACADALERYTAAEPFAYATFHIEAGRYLAALAESEPSPPDAFIAKAAVMGYRRSSERVKAIAVRGAQRNVSSAAVVNQKT